MQPAADCQDSKIGITEKPHCLSQPVRSEISLSTRSSDCPTASRHISLIASSLSKIFFFALFSYTASPIHFFLPSGRVICQTARNSETTIWYPTTPRKFILLKRSLYYSSHKEHQLHLQQPRIHGEYIAITGN